MSATVVITSRLGQDPELRYTEKGVAVCTFSLPVDVGWGENKDTEWVRVTVWGTRAEQCNEYLRKGSTVSVTATFEKTWVSSKGDASIQVKADRVDFISGFGKSEPKEYEEAFEDMPF